MNFDITNASQILSRTPATLQALLGGLPDEWTHCDEGADTFSPFDVVGHLIDGEETDWMPRARMILERIPGQEFVPFDRFRHRDRNRGRSLAGLLAEFAELRRKNLAELAGWRLTAAELELPGNHPSLGRVTLANLLATWAVHDLGHLAQVSRVMAKQYRDSVGPWVPFLPVLTDHERPRS